MQVKATFESYHMKIGVITSNALEILFNNSVPNIQAHNSSVERVIDYKAATLVLAQNN